MIAPDMATMLAFVFTDAPIARGALQTLLRERCRRHLQRDHHRRRHLDLRHAAAFATGAPRRAARPTSSGANDPRLAAFRKALDAVLPISPSRWRATARARASWSRSRRGRGVERPRRAKRIALSIANSPLVKTAIAGEDANWGRVVMAVGKAGEPADRDRLSIWFNGIRVAHKGARDPAYDEAAVSGDHEARRNRAQGRARPRQGPRPVLTCDLTKEYVAINGDYRS